MAGAICSARSQDVTPRVRGGRTAWANVVTACEPCNLRKGHRLPRECGIWPLRPPTYELQENGGAFPPDYLHESWREYLCWDTELEES